MVTTEQELTRNEKMVQQIAETLYTAATNEEHAISGGRVYTNLQTAFVAAIREVYKLNRKRANQVRDLLAEYGPQDRLTGTEAFGIKGYVQFALKHTADKEF